MARNGVEVVTTELEGNSLEAVKNILSEKSSGLDPDFAFVFVSPKINVERFNDELDKQLDFDYVGCTTAGELGPEGPSESSVVTLFVERDDIDFSISVQEEIHHNPKYKGEMLAESVQEKLGAFENDGVFLITSGVTRVREPVGYEVLKGLSSVLPSDIPISGGAAGDNMNFKKTFQFVNGKVLDDGVVAVSISTDNNIESVQAHGKKNTVSTGVVRRGEGREIIEIGDKSAARFYADAVGKDVSDLRKLYDLDFLEKISFGISALKNKILGRNPLLISEIFNYSLDYAISEDIGPNEKIVTQPIRVTDRGGILLSREIKENQVIKVLEGDRQEIVSAGSESLKNISDPVFALIADCVTRKEILDEDELEQEVSQIENVLGDVFAGWYAMGEIGQGENLICTHMNQTVSGLVLTQKE